MVAVTFFAFDSEALLVSLNVDGGADTAVGSAIINNSDTPIGTEWTYQPGFVAQFVTVDDTLDDNGAPIDIFDDDETADHSIIDGSGLVGNGIAVESESVHTLQALDENGDPVGDPFDIFVFSQGGVTQDVWGFGTTQTLIPGVTYRKVGGSNIGDSVYADLICFASGTMIRTPNGRRAVETLKAGDVVWTKSNPEAKISWVGSRTVPARGAFAPVSFAPQTVGNDEQLVVSQQHRILLSNLQTRLMFDASAVLAPAVSLVDMPGVEIVEGGDVTYHHILFDKHEIVESCGALSESLYPGESALAALDRPAREEVLSLFPELAEDPALFEHAAYPLRKFEASALTRSLRGSP